MKEAIRRLEAVQLSRGAVLAQCQKMFVSPSLIPLIAYPNTHLTYLLQVFTTPTVLTP